MKYLEKERLDRIKKTIAVASMMTPDCCLEFRVSDIEVLLQNYENLINSTNNNRRNDES